MFIGVVNTFDAVKKKRKKDNHLLDIVRLVAACLFYNYTQGKRENVHVVHTTIAQSAE